MILSMKHIFGCSVGQVLKCRCDIVCCELQGRGLVAPHCSTADALSVFCRTGHTGHQPAHNVHACLVDMFKFGGEWRGISKILFT